jgi:hypothetical protein
MGWGLRSSTIVLYHQPFCNLLQTTHARKLQENVFQIDYLRASQIQPIVDVSMVAVRVCGTNIKEERTNIPAGESNVAGWILSNERQNKTTREKTCSLKDTQRALFFAENITVMLLQH